MWALFVLWLISFCTSKEYDRNIQERYLDSIHQDCIADQNVVYAFRSSYDDFVIKLFKAAARRSNYFVTISPLLTWITLAAIAEGGDPSTQNEVFKVLNLPENICSRQKYYRVAISRLAKSIDVSFIHNRVLLIDENLQINSYWYKYVEQNSLLQVISAPIKQDPRLASDIIKKFALAPKRGLDLSGNSILINSMDYNGLWTTAFPDSTVQRSAFFSQSGRRIGSVDLMKVKRKVRIGRASIFSKIIEIPVGRNEEYRMLFALNDDNTVSIPAGIMSLNSSTIKDVISSLRDSYVPIDIAIPRFEISSEVDMRTVLQDMGVVSPWINSEATRYISNPPAQLSNYIQRVKVTVTTDGINHPLPQYASYPVKEEDRYWSEFIANRPFIFGLYDAETFTKIIATLVTEPTYPF